MIPTFAYFNGPQDWLIVAGLVVLLFGGSKIPQLARGMGEGIREFKKSMGGGEDETPTTTPTPTGTVVTHTTTTETVPSGK